MAKGKAAEGVTPMAILRQYTAIKAQYPDAILFFRLGGFFRAFEDDARAISATIGVAVEEFTIPNGPVVCTLAVPFFAAEGHIAKIVATGKKVAVCEQTGGAL